MIRFLDLQTDYKILDTEIRQATVAVLESGRYILGENVRKFEQEFAAFCGSLYGIGVGSGTEAIHLALVACGVGAGDEVITSPFTAAPTVLAISAAQATPVFVDVDSTYTLNPSKLKSAITSRTKAIIPVHLFGYPADLDPILEIAQMQNLALIEDACQAHGTEYKGRKVGSIGQMGCFSFYPTKNLGAYGDAGMIVTNDPGYFNKLVSLRNLGQTGRFHHEIRGFNSRMDELQAAILSVKLKHLNSWNQKRTELAHAYNKLLQAENLELPPKSPFAKSNHHLYVIRSAKRNELKTFLETEGIETLIHYPTPVHLQPAYRDLGIGQGTFPMSEKYADEVLSLPLNTTLAISQVESIAKKVLKFIHS